MDLGYLGSGMAGLHGRFFIGLRKLVGTAENLTKTFCLDSGGMLSFGGVLPRTFPQCFVCDDEASLDIP